MDAATIAPTYETYKPSGVPWLGDIPDHWLVERGKWQHKFNKLLNKRGACDNILSLTLRGVVNNNPDDPEGLVPKDYGTYQIFEKDDLVFKLIDLENFKTSRVGIVHERGVMSPAYIRLTPSQQAVPKYHFYLYYTLYQQGIYNKIGAGVRSMLGPTDLLELPTLHPPKDEQLRIADFLDQKTSEIDETIAKKQRLIELLKEQRTILIKLAVTKGLNPDVPLRDSGVEWIGDVPAHWEVIRLKLLFSEVNARTKSGEEELLSLRMHAGLVPHNDVSDKPITDVELIDYKLIMPGQMVMNRMRASIGLFGVANSTGLVSPDYAVFDIDADIDAGYYLALFKTSVMGGVFRLNSKGLGTGASGFMRLYTDNFGRIKVPLPPKEEQEEINLQIKKMNEEFGAAEKKVASEIDLLNEMRATIISHAVTGKIKL